MMWISAYRKLGSNCYLKVAITAQPIEERPFVSFDVGGIAILSFIFAIHTAYVL